MADNVEQVKKNIQTSFGYVKKDLLMVNDAISDVHEKIQHLSLNHASLMGQMAKLSARLEKIEGKKSQKKSAKKTTKAKAPVIKKIVKKVAKAKPIKKVVKETETVTYS